MPITPQQLATRRKAVTFTFADEPIHIEYFPAAINAESLVAVQDIYNRMNAAIASESTTQDEAEALMLEVGAWVERMLASWDYLEDDAALGAVGAPIPITAERIVFEMQRFGDFIMAVISAIGQDYNQGKARGADSSAPSGATSSPTGRSRSSTATGRSRKRSA